jgi:hypothetical protein
MKRVGQQRKVYIPRRERGVPSGIKKQVTGKLKIRQNQKGNTEQHKEHSLAQTPAPNGKGKLKAQPQSEENTSVDNRLVI